MLFVNLKAQASRERVLDILNETRDMVKPRAENDNRGRPSMSIAENGGKIKVLCKFIGGANQDYGAGTYFIGRIREKNGETTLSGVILTKPLFHILFIALFAFFVYRCIALGAFNVVPVCLAVFCVLMFRSEYAKQPIIRRYLARAFRIAQREGEEK